MRLYYLHQRVKGGTWYVTFTNQDTGKLGTRRSTKTSNCREAEKVAQTWLQEGIPDAPKSLQQTFCEYRRNYFINNFS